MRPLPLLACLLAAAGVAAGCQGSPPSSKRSIEMAACRVKGLPGQVECGALEVAEDPASPEGRRIRLRIVRVPAVKPSAGTPPLFLLAGGPGQAATEAFPPVIAGLGLHRKGRSIVLVDQRGTGSSSPLDCEAKNVELRHRFRTEVAPEEVAECRDALDADLTMYTTPIAADDLDRVREALGYPAIDLLGMSYGTRLGLVYMRRHGEHVRAAVLDGTAPPAMNIPLAIAEDADRALKRLFEACAQQPSCAGAFGAPIDALATVFERLGEEGLPLSVRNAISGQTETLNLSAKAFALTLRLMLYNSDLSSLVPLTLSQAAAGNFDPFIAQGSMFGVELDSSMSVGMMLSVLCSEDLARIEAMDASAVRSTYEGTFLGDAGLNALRQSCSLWPKAQLPSGYWDPVASAIPSLVLSGEDDPVTPPRWGSSVAQHLSSSQHLVVPGAAHGTVLVGCMPKLVTEFLDEPRKPVSAGCILENRRPPFFVDGAGPPH